MEKIYKNVDRLYYGALIVLIVIIICQLFAINRTITIGIEDAHNNTSDFEVVGTVDYEVYRPTKYIQTTTTSEETTESEEIVEIKPQADIRTFRVTAYCSCSRCCGVWAENRDRDENGDEIVLGASGQRLISGVSAAGTLPFGTKVNLDGFGEVVIHDRFAKWIVDKYGEDVIDLYFINHDEAVEWGVKYLEGEVLYAK